MSDTAEAKASAALNERIEALPEAQQTVARHLIERKGADFVKGLLDKLAAIAAEGGSAPTRDDLLAEGFDPEELDEILDDDTSTNEDNETD